MRATQGFRLRFRIQGGRNPLSIEDGKENEGEREQKSKDLRRSRRHKRISERTCIVDFLRASLQIVCPGLQIEFAFVFTASMPHASFALLSYWTSKASSPIATLKVGQKSNVMLTANFLCAWSKLDLRVKNKIRRAGGSSDHSRTVGRSDGGIFVLALGSRLDGLRTTKTTLTGQIFWSSYQTEKTGE